MNNEGPEARTGIIRAGQVALIAGAVSFVAVFSYLAAKFHYPEVLDGNAADVLPALLATGDGGRLVWAIYSMLPLLWIPAGVGAFHALRREGEGRMHLAVLFALISSLAMSLGLMRWPSLQWELAQSWTSTSADRATLTTIFNAANVYLGNYIGEFLGEFAISVFFVLSASAMLKARSRYPAWIGWMVSLTGALGLIGMFRNVTHSVQPIADINNYLLPLWMIVFGVSLWRRAGNAVIGE